MSDVVITGCGVVCPLGIGNEAVWKAIENRQSGISPIEELVAVNWMAPFGGKIRNFNPKDYIRPRKSLKVMSNVIQFGFAASVIAWENAKFGDFKIDPERVGVVGGSSVMYCDLEEVCNAFKVCLEANTFDFTKWGKMGIGEFFPLWLLKYLPNMPSCHVGIALDARGPTNTIVQGAVSSLLSLQEAASVIQRGQADVMIAGATSSKISLWEVLWHKGARLSLNTKNPTGACRPFDAERDGAVYGEGSGQFILENREHAERRGAKILGTILGWGNTSEATTETLLPTGDSLARAMDQALESSGVTVSDLSHINVHGNSTLEEDFIEARVLNEKMPEVPVTALKSYFGDIGAGSGAVETAISLLAQQQKKIPPTLNYETPDKACPINLVTKMQTTEKKTFM